MGGVEMPEGPVGKKTWLFWNPYLICAKTPHPRKRGQCYKELIRSEVQARPAALGAGIPSNKIKAGLDAFLNSRPPPIIPRSSEASIMLSQKWRCSQPTLAA